MKLRIIGSPRKAEQILESPVDLSFVHVIEIDEAQAKSLSLKHPDVFSIDGPLPNQEALTLEHRAKKNKMLKAGSNFKSKEGS